MDDNNTARMKMNRIAGMVKDKYPRRRESVVQLKNDGTTI